MKVTILLYPGVTALDAIGPYEVLSRPPGWSVAFAALVPGEIRADTGYLGLHADVALDDVQATDLLLVPGGPLSRVPADPQTLAHVRRLHATDSLTASVCTGAFVLGRAGLLSGVRATTAWSRHEGLDTFGAVRVEERVVVDGRIATSAGVSAGIDLALTLVGQLVSPEVAQLIQLGIEYDPHPPYNSGHPHCAPAGIVETYRMLALA